jgi:hypothetical protein
MFKLGTAVGMAVGYLAANESARQKVWTTAKDAWQSPRAKAVEQKVVEKLPSLTQRLPGGIDLTSPDSGTSSTSSPAKTSAATGS